MIFSKKIFLFILFTIGILNFSFAQDVTVDKTSILIGEPINYIITSNNKLSLSVPDSFAHFILINKSDIDTTTSQAVKAYATKLVFTSFDSGTFAIPSLSYTQEGSTKIFKTDSISIQVNYMPLDANKQPRDIKTIIETDYQNYDWLKIALAVLAVLVIAFIVWFIFKKKKIVQPAVNKTLLYNQAIEALQKLAYANENNSITVKDLHTQLISIFKTYYGGLTHYNLQNKTSAEILAKLKSHELKATQANEVSKALQTGDGTKFAKYKPSVTENAEAIVYIKNTITALSQLSLKN
jgi:hypothetical protein